MKQSLESYLTELQLFDRDDLGDGLIKQMEKISHEIPLLDLAKLRVTIGGSTCTKEELKKLVLIDLSRAILGVLNPLLCTPHQQKDTYEVVLKALCERYSIPQVGLFDWIRSTSLDRQILSDPKPTITTGQYIDILHNLELY